MFSVLRITYFPVIFTPYCFNIAYKAAVQPAVNQLHSSADYEHIVNLGASIINLNFAQVTVSVNGMESTSDLPVITRYGANYQFTLKKQFLFDSLDFLKIFTQGEYKMLLNSDFYSGYHFGGEITLFELLALRLGYYYEKVDDHGNPTYNNNNIHSLTYGIGLQIPLNKLTKLPLNINFDYTSLPQPSYTKSETDLANFTSYNLRLNWIMKNNK